MVGETSIKPGITTENKSRNNKSGTIGSTIRPIVTMAGMALDDRAGVLGITPTIML